MTTAAATAISLRAKLELAGLAIAAVLAFAGFRTWLHEHDDRLRAEAQIAAAQKSFDQASAELKQLEAAQAAKDQAAAATIAKVTAAAAAQRTPAQIVKWLPAQFPNLPAPIRSSIPAPTAQNPLPDALLTVPQVDLSFLRDQLAKCQEDVLELPAAQSGLNSCKTEQRILAGQIQDLQQKNDALATELKGGTFWQRMKRGAKQLAIGAALGAAALCGTGHCKP